MAEGKNIYIVCPDESPQPTESVDKEDRTDESIAREKVYDDEISPIVQQLIKKCKEHKMPLFLECEWNPGDFCKTVIKLDEWNPHPVFTTLNVISQCIQGEGVNIDKYLYWILKQVKEAGGHSSMFLTQLGYDPETGKYNWDTAYHMLQGAKSARKSENQKERKEEC